MAATVPVSLMVRCSGLGVGFWSEAVLLCEGSNELDGVGVGGMLLAVLRAGQALFAEAVGI